MRFSTVAAAAAMLGLAALATAAPAASQALIGFGPGVSVGFPPPPLPIYDQPAIPDYGYMWAPGYWAWEPSFGDYFWVPGTWVLPPGDGLLWTPAWWGWSGRLFVFHPGYWGSHIGYYGGVDYGFGYTGYGYQGGYWRGHQFFYNRAVNNVRSVRITNVFERPVMSTPWHSRVSYAGGVGGIVARATPEQIAAMREPHFGPTAEQTGHVQMAGSDRRLSAKVNHGAPPITATARAATRPGPHAPPAYPLQRGSPPHTDSPDGYPGYRPVAPPPDRQAHGNAPGYAAPRPPNTTAGGAPPFHPTANGPGRFAPPPRQAAPSQPFRPTPPAQRSDKPPNPPH